MNERVAYLDGWRPRICRCPTPKLRGMMADPRRLAENCHSYVFLIGDMRDDGEVPG
jgi:hypothetical protein